MKLEEATGQNGQRADFEFPPVVQDNVCWSVFSEQGEAHHYDLNDFILMVHFSESHIS